MLFFLHSEEFLHDETKRTAVTLPVFFFIFEYQRLNFRANLVIQNYKISLFPKNLTEPNIFHNFLRLLVLDFFFKFITAASIDSMKMLCTTRWLGCWFEFYGRKKGKSYSFFILFFTILFSILSISKRTRRILLNVFSRGFWSKWLTVEQCVYWWSKCFNIWIEK